MSHTTKIKSVPIKSISALRAAVADLQSQGIRCELRENEKPRMYYADQLAKHLGKQDGKAEFVLHLADAAYDVGFVAEQDGSFTPVFDSWRGEVKRVLGNGGEGQAGEMGKLLQAYSKAVAIESAVSQGYTVLSCDFDSKGQIQLSIGV